MRPLPVDFYANSEVLQVARALLGKQLWVQAASGLRTGIITETEAYASTHDKASHAAGGKRTARNAVMFGPPGKTYVYLCYGIHHLLNIVTGPEGEAAAVLIRGLTPLAPAAPASAGRGPGKLCRWLGIDRRWNGADVQGPQIWLTDGIQVADDQVAFTPRIGVAYAGSDALLLYRCYMLGADSVSFPLYPKYPR